MISTRKVNLYTAIKITDSTKSKLYYYRKTGLLKFDALGQIDFFNIMILKIMSDFTIPKDHQKYIYQLIQDSQKFWKFDTDYHVFFNDGITTLRDLDDLNRLNSMCGQRFICCLHLPSIYNDLINNYYEIIA